MSPEGVRWRRGWIAALCAGVLALGAAGVVVVTGAAPSESAASSTAASSVIDRTAGDSIAPPDSVVDVKRAFGARGDGYTDDTAAIQAAISANLGFSSANKVLYFPDGTYRVTRPLEWRDRTGRWQTWLTLMGQNRDRAVIKLSDAAAGYGNPVFPRAVIVTGSQSPMADDGSGNQAFHNSLSDLTVDVGTGNPGAVGVDYMANNRGSLRNIVVRAPAGSGAVGISMTRRFPGPCFLQDVAVRGFAVGVDVAQPEYGVTIEHLRLSGQGSAGLRNTQNLLSLRDLVSTNQVPAVQNGRIPGDRGVVVVDGARLEGGTSASAAIESSGEISGSGLTSSGYRAVVSHDGADLNPSPSDVVTSTAAPNARITRGSATEVPAAEPPPFPSVPASGVRPVATDGAIAGDQRDDTAGIQAALDSGAPVVTLRSGRYLVTRTLTVPPSVRAIVGLEATIYSTKGMFLDGSTAPIFRIAGDTTQPLVVGQLFFAAPNTVLDFEKLSPRPVHLQDIHTAGVSFRGGPGDVFVTNVDGGDGWEFSPGQRVWARQLDVERLNRKITNRGAQLWILGLKTEGADTAIVSTGHARTRVVGGLLYPASAVPPFTPAFIVIDSSFSASIVESSYRPDFAHQVLLFSITSGVPSRTPAAASPRRGMAGFIALGIRAG